MVTEGSVLTGDTVKSMDTGEYWCKDMKYLINNGWIVLFYFLSFKSRSAICTCPSGYMGEHCEYRVDINENPFKSSHQIVHQDAGFSKILGLILIMFGAIVGSVVYFYFHPFGQTKPAVNMTENGASSCCDDIQLDSTMISNKEADGHGGCPGFSGVELL